MKSNDKQIIAGYTFTRTPEGAWQVEAIGVKLRALSRRMHVFVQAGDTMATGPYFVAEVPDEMYVRAVDQYAEQICHYDARGALLPERVKEALARGEIAFIRAQYRDGALRVKMHYCDGELRSQFKSMFGAGISAGTVYFDREREEWVMTDGFDMHQMERFADDYNDEVAQRAADGMPRLMSIDDFIAA